MAYNLGSAYIQVVPVSKGLSKGIEKELSGVGGRASKSMGGKLWGGLKVGAAGAAAGIAGVLSGAVVKGFQRLSAIEDAEAKLTGLGHSGEEVQTIMDSALAAVKGTAYGMGDAASLAATMVAAGIEPGKELEDTLKLVADTATITGRDLSDVGLIWSQVASKGKLQGDDAMQLMEAGIPVWQLIGKEMGVTAAEAQELGSKGKVSFDTFRSAMEDGLGGAALESGKTVRGAFNNMTAALGRFGAALLEDLYPYIGPLFGKITELFDYLTEKAGPAMDWLSSSIKDFVGSSGFQSFLEGVKNVAVTLYERALKPLGAWVADNWQLIAGALGGLAAFFVGGALISAITAVGAAIGAFVGGISWVAVAVGGAVAALSGFFTGTERGRAILGGFVAFVRDTLWPVVVGAFTAIRDFVVGQLWPMLQSTFTAIRDLTVQVWQGVIQPAFEQFAGFVRDTVMPIIMRLWTEYVQPVFTLIGGLAVWLWNNAIKPAMSAIYTFIGTVLGPVIVWLWKNVVSPAFSAIGAIISFAWNNVIFPALDAMKFFFSGILAPVVMWLWRNVIQPAWAGIRIAIAVAVTAIKATIAVLKWVFDRVIAPVVMWLWRNVFQPAWAGIRAAISAVVTWFRDTAWPIFSNVIGWIRAKFEQLKLGLQIIWRFIKNNVIAPVVNWFKNTVWPVFSTVIGWIRNKFEQLKLGLQIIWRFIKNNVIAPVVNWFRDTVWPILSTVIGWIRNKFEQLKLALQIIWRFIKNNVIAPFVNWFRDHVWPLISRIIGYIKTGFNTMRDAIKAAWDSVKNKAIAPVVNWFSEKVKPKIDKFTGNVKDAFNSLKDTVLEAWGKIESGMKKPINGVIDIYNEHIAGNFNSVADTLGLEDKYRLEEMAGFASGGYTGPGSKYKEAGIVHADEYVIRKESQRGIERSAPGFLDALNRHGSRALGYASGGLVKLRMPFAGSYPRGDGYGARGGKHKGIDWPIPAGTALKAVAAGTARRTRNAKAGNKLELSIGNGLTAGYHHMSRFAVASGASVGRGADIGYVGSTGRSSGPHLHFSLKRDGKYVDPAPYLGAGGSAGSGDGGGWWNPFTNLWSSIKDKVSSAVGDTPVGGIVSKVAENTISGIGAWVTDKITAIGDVVGDVADTTGGYARWSPIASAALALEGEVDPRNLGSLMRRMKQESGFNPRAINNWDSNASRGTPSKGLMQVIDPTFRAYARPGYDKDIWDPMSNILASIRYARARYGDVRKGWDRKGGYSDGGLVKPFLHDSGGWHQPGSLSVNQTQKPEAVLTNGQWKSISALAAQSVRPAAGVTVENITAADPQEAVRAFRADEAKRRALYARVA